VALVQLPPAVRHVTLVTELARSGRTSELDEGGVRAIAKVDQLRVDVLNLHESVTGTFVAGGLPATY
jgi:hypothetical protein